MRVVELAAVVGFQHIALTEPVPGLLALVGRPLDLLGDWELPAPAVCGLTLA